MNALVNRSLQQVWPSGSQSIDPQRGSNPLPICQLSVRLFSARTASGGCSVPCQHRHQQRTIRKAIPAWYRPHNSFEAVQVGVASIGCLGVVVTVASVAVANEESASSSSPLSLANQGTSGKPKVVVLGTGWGGISFVKGIDTNLFDVQIVSPRNYFVFTPLLPSVTNGTVEARSIAEPIRRILSKDKRPVQYFEAECFEIDNEKKQLHCRDVSGLKIPGKDEFIVEYDYLIIAVGALANTFGTPGVKEYCHFLKELEDAERIRLSVVDCFETASLPHLTDDERRRILGFVIIGGGPTGVEFAAELHDIVTEDFVTLYPHLQKFVSVTIIQSADHILNSFDQRISEYAESKFKRDGLKVQTNCRVLKVNEADVLVREKATGHEVSIPFGMAVWSTGIGTRPVISELMKKIGQGNRLVLATDEWLRVKGVHSTWAIGDCATIEQRAVMEDIEDLFHKADLENSGTLTIKEFKDTLELVRERYPQIDLYMQRQHLKSYQDFVTTVVVAGKEEKVELSLDQFKSALSQVDSQMKHLPATAQVASQQGVYLANCFNHLLNKNELPEGPMRIHSEGRHRFHPFRYTHLGQFAPLGTEQCGAELPGDWVSVGRSSQWLWYSVYASKQVSWRTRALVIFDWTKRFLFGRDSSQM